MFFSNCNAPVKSYGLTGARGVTACRRRLKNGVKAFIFFEVPGIRTLFRVKKRRSLQAGTLALQSSRNFLLRDYN